MTLLMYCHVFAVSIAAAHGVYVTVGLLRRWLNIQQAKIWFVAIAIAVLAFTPWIISMKIVAKETAAFWPAGPNFATCALLIVYAAINYFAEYEPLTKIGFCLTLLSCAVALFCPLIMKRNIDQQNWLRMFYCVGLVNVMVLGFLLAEVVHAFHVRHIGHAIAFILLLIIVSVDWIFARLPKVVSFSLPLLIMLIWWLPQLSKIRDLSTGSVYQAVQPIKANFDKSKDLVVCAYEVYAPECARQLPKDFKLITFPDIEQVDYVYFPGFHDRFLNKENYFRAEKFMDATLKRGGKIWFIEHQLAKNHLKANHRSTIAGNESIYDLEFIAADRLRDWLGEHAELDGEARYFMSNDTSLAERCFVAKKFGTQGG